MTTKREKRMHFSWSGFIYGWAHICDSLVGLLTPSARENVAPIGLIDQREIPFESIASISIDDYFPHRLNKRNRWNSVNLSKSLFTQLVNDFDINHSSGMDLVCVQSQKPPPHEYINCLNLCACESKWETTPGCGRIWKWTIFEHDKSIKSIKLNRDIIECAPNSCLITNDSFEIAPGMLFSCLFFYGRGNRNAKIKIKWPKSISNKFT